MANKRRNVDQERRWRERIKRQAGSGLTVRAFCRREKLSEPSFHAWRRTLRQRDAAAELPQRITSAVDRPRPAFLPVIVPDNRLDGAITIELAGGRALRLPGSIAAERLAELVRALEASTPR